MKIIDCVQGSEEWFAARLGKVTGSMFAVAKGKGKTRQTYMKNLIEELRTGKPTEYAVNKYMLWGTEMEPYARAEYEWQKQVSVREVGFVELNEHIGVSPDGLVDVNGAIEIKCPTLDNHNKTTGLPSRYKAQAQGVLWVTDRKWLDFVSYHPDAEKPLFCQRVYRDEAYITELKVRIYMFVADMKAMIEESK